MYITIVIATNFEPEKEEAWIEGTGDYPPIYFPTDMMRDGLNDYLCQLGVGFGNDFTSVWSDWFKEEYGWIPTMRVVSVHEATHIPNANDPDHWVHQLGQGYARKKDKEIH